MLTDKQILELAKGAAAAIAELATRLLDAEARVKVLEKVLGPLAEACFDEYCSDDTEKGDHKCEDDEPVSFGKCPITFGMIRRARAALQEQSK
jgi:hypothetical protein